MQPLSKLLLIRCTIAAAFDVTFYVTREVQGAVYPVNRVNGTQCNAVSNAVYSDCDCLGGLAKRRQFVGQGSPAEISANVVALDTGSFYSGSGRFYPAFKRGTDDQRAYASEILARSIPEAYGLTYLDFAAGGAEGTYHDAQAYPEYLIKFKQ